MPEENDLDRVLSHIRARQRSHPESPATGLSGMTDEQWRACVHTLRERGHQIAATVCAHGDRGANTTGYRSS